jgi:hypothetical protein
VSVFDRVDDRAEVQALLSALQAAGRSLEKLLAKHSSDWGYEDPVYRFYHQSYKVYSLQGSTLEIVDALHALAPARPLNASFTQLVRRGTGKEFELEHNEHWVEETAPIVEAFFHARFFLEMAVRYAKTLQRPPVLLPSGWAALLYLFDLR